MKTSPGHATNVHGPMRMTWISAGRHCAAASVKRPSAAARASTVRADVPNQSHSAVRTVVRGSPVRRMVSSRSSAARSRSSASAGAGKTCRGRSTPADPAARSMSVRWTIPARACSTARPSRIPSRSASAKVLPRVTCRGLWLPAGPEWYRTGQPVPTTWRCRYCRIRPGKSALIRVESSCSTVGCMQQTVMSASGACDAASRMLKTGTRRSEGPAGSRRLVPTPVASATASPASAGRAFLKASSPARTIPSSSAAMYSGSGAGADVPARRCGRSTGSGPEWVCVAETRIRSSGTPVRRARRRRTRAASALEIYRMSLAISSTRVRPSSRNSAALSSGSWIPVLIRSTFG